MSIAAQPSDRRVSSEPSSKDLIGALRRSKLFRQYERVFTDATGFPLAIQPLEFWQLAHQGKAHENTFCALLARRPATLSVCLQAHDELVRRTHDLPVTTTCPFGLTESAVPVRLGSKTIGFLRIGQVLRRSPDRSDASKVEHALKKQGVKFDAELRKAWDMNPVVPPEKYSAVVRLLSFFAEQLSSLCNRIVTETKNSEPPLVAKARTFIEQNKTEDISLADVAAAAGASVYHFCKVFHQATGVTFTDYLARVRAEDARALLLNPNKRISEVAYEVGFQSLTQFNRTFKRVFGESPSRFRSR